MSGFGEYRWDFSSLRCLGEFAEVFWIGADVRGAATWIDAAKVAEAIGLSEMTKGIVAGNQDAICFRIVATLALIQPSSSSSFASYFSAFSSNNLASSGCSLLSSSSMR